MIIPDVEMSNFPVSSIIFQQTFLFLIPWQITESNEMGIGFERFEKWMVEKR